MPIELARERKLMLEMILALRDLGAAHYFRGRGISGRIPRSQIEILALIFLGHAAGRPATITTISKATEMPRATVERRITALMELGLIERRGNSYCVVPCVANSPDTLAMVKKSIHRVLSTADRLRALGH